MFRQFIMPATLGLSALCALIPGTASAQSYGGWNHSVYSDRGHDDQYDRGNRGQSGYNDRGYRARQRWIQHRRWEEARRRHWQHRRWDRGDDRRDWNGDRRGWHDDRGY